MREAALLFLALAVGCSSSGGEGCTVLQGDGNLAGLGVGPSQIMIEARIVLIDQTSFDDLGLAFGSTAAVTNDNGGFFGAVSRQGSDVVADGQTLGGPAGVPYLAPNNFGGLLSIVNLNFISPFLGQPTKAFVCPLGGACFRVDPAVATEIQNFAGGAAQNPLSPIDPGFAGTCFHELLDDVALASLISQIESDTRNSVLDAPSLTTFDNQRAVIVLQDVEPMIGDLAAPFQGAVQAVTPTPFGIFTGVTLDVRPTIVNNQVLLEVRLGTQVVSAFRSVPANVGNQPADVEIPFIASSVAKTMVMVANGQTLVIGGLQRDGQTTVEKGIPVLGNLPIVGNLLRNHSNDQQNLILMVTPTIILGDEQEQ